MDSRTITVACPQCGRPATITVYTEHEQHLAFEFDCPTGHHVPGARARELWIAAPAVRGGDRIPFRQT